MTRGQIREILRRNLRDVPQVQWPDDAELDLLIEQSYLLMQKEVVKVDREAHLTWDYMNASQGVSWYPLPPTFGVQQVGLKDTTTGLYKVLTRKGYRALQAVASGASGRSRRYYARRGQWIYISPAPETNIAEGIELVHTGIRALSGDTDVPVLKVPTHMAIVYWSKILALSETEETTGETTKRLSEILGDLPAWYEASGDDPDAFGMDVIGVSQANDLDNGN